MLWRNGANIKTSSYERKTEDYLADFDILVRRSLAPAEKMLFDLYFIDEADYKTCIRLLAVDRGKFFHTVYRIEAKLGRLCRDLRPYSLFPVCDYFA